MLEAPDYSRETHWGWNNHNHVGIKSLLQPFYFSSSGRDPTQRDGHMGMAMSNPFFKDGWNSEDLVFFLIKNLIVAI